MNFKNMSIKKSLIIGFGTTILIAAIIIIASLVMMNMQKNAYSDIIDEYVEANNQASLCRISYNRQDERAVYPRAGAQGCISIRGYGRAGRLYQHNNGVG